MMRRNPHSFVHGRHGNRGVALVLVLWLIVLLTVVGISHSRSVRLDVSVSSHVRSHIKAKMLAESALNLAILELYKSKDDEHAPFNGEQFVLEMPGGHVLLKIRNASGLVDLNKASPDLLEALLDVAQLDDERKLALVDAIQDWRDGDDLVHPNGAEDQDYRVAGLDYGTPDKPFFSIGELRYVLGMDTQLYNRLAPYITVHSGMSTVNPDYAPPELLTLATQESGADTDFVQNIGNSRPFSNALGYDVLQNTPTAGKESDVFHISVWATDEGGGMAGLEVDVSPGRGRAGLKIYVWTESSQSIQPDQSM